MKTFACIVLLWMACVMQAWAGVAPERVVESARAQGTVRVLVVLRDVAPRVDRTKLAERKRAVAHRVDGLFARTPRSHLRVRTRFDLVPAIALEADAATLQRLAADPDVLRIDLDMPGGGQAVAPDGALALSHVADMANLGLSGKGMKVAVIDSGIDTDHPDFVGRILGQQCFCSINGSSAGCCPNALPTQSGAGAAEDAHGHGTNVTGIIAGNGTVAPRGGVPQVGIVAVRVIDANNRFCCSSDIVKAMDWVAANHPDVDAVNMSLGTDALFGGDCDTASSSTIALANAIANLRALGANVSVSAGNEGSTTSMGAPACVHDAFSVANAYDANYGSVNWTSCTDPAPAPRQLTCTSNRSPTTDIVGPGTWVTAPGRGGASSTFAGTSQAAPQATACAIALKQQWPMSTVAQREDVMRLSTTRVADAVSGRTYPFLDCAEALRVMSGNDLACKVAPKPPVVAPVAPKATSRTDTSPALRRSSLRMEMR